MVCKQFPGIRRELQGGVLDGFDLLFGEFSDNFQATFTQCFCNFLLFFKSMLATCLPFLTTLLSPVCYFCNFRATFGQLVGESDTRNRRTGTGEPETGEPETGTGNRRRKRTEGSTGFFDEEVSGSNTYRPTPRTIMAL